MNLLYIITLYTCVPDTYQLFKTLWSSHDYFMWICEEDQMRTAADSPFLHWTILQNWNFSKLKPLLVKSYVRMQSHVGSSKTLVFMYQIMHCHVSDHGHHCDKISFNSLQLLCCTHQGANKLAVTQIMCYTWQLTLRLVHIKMRTKLHNI